MEVCRDRYGDFSPGIFNLWTCAMCYHYLFQDKKELRVNWPLGSSLKATNSSLFHEGQVIYTDITNQTVSRLVCRTLDEYNCKRWRQCCLAAVTCCEKQLLDKRFVPVRPGYCPQTWDGFSCVNEVLKGNTVYITCPPYIDQRSPLGRAEKTCDNNASWWREPETGLEWTDYTKCVNLAGYGILFHVAVICNVLSLALLLPACVIFLWYRILRRQHRVRIHLNLFISFIVRTIVVILWDNLVYNNRLQNLAEETLMHQNTVGCKILYILTRYALAANFSWMFLEGFHLHRLIVRAFKVPKSICGYYLAGWASPALPVLIYSMIRIYRQDQECWVQNTGYYEWILYVPNLLCIVVNVFFLCGILRILLNQLQTHPNEPNNYRKALKASFVLVPLFGVQLFLVIYRPPQELDISFPFEILSEIMSNSQGGLVSLLLCFFNHEVRAHLRGTLPVLRKDVGLKLGVLRSYTKKNYLTNANENNDITSCKSRLDPGPKSEQPESYQNNRDHTLCILTNKCVVVDNH